MTKEDPDFLAMWAKVAKEYSDIKEIQFSEEGSIEDLPAGCVNYVVRCKSKDGSRSVIMKHAPPFVKVIGPSYPLNPVRLSHEFDIMKKFDEVCPGSVAKPYCYHQETNSIYMEDLSEFKDLSRETKVERVDEEAIQNLARTVGIIHQATHKAVLTTVQFEDLIKKYQCLDMDVFTENYFFKHPYQKEFPGHQSSEVLGTGVDRVHEDQSLREAKDKLRKIFLTKKECLLHGDLHTGACMVKQGKAKLIDMELATVGPAAYDLGVLVASYIQSYIGHMLAPNDNEHHRQTAFKMLQAAKTTVETYFEHMTAHSGDRIEYINNLMSEAAGFCGMEMICRTVGNFYLPDIKGVPGADVECLGSGIRLLESYHRLHDIDSLLNIALMLT